VWFEYAFEVNLVAILIEYAVEVEHAHALLFGAVLAVLLNVSFFLL
jgi:hypothetical protein